MEIGRRAAAQVVVHRNLRDLHQSALDRVYEPEVADDPRERPPDRVPAAVDVKRRRGKVDAGEDRPCAVNLLQACDPLGRALVLFLFVFGDRLVYFEELLVLLDLRLIARAVAVVPFVVQHQQPLLASQDLLQQPVGEGGVGFRAKLLDAPLLRVVQDRHFLPMDDVQLHRAEKLRAERARHDLECIVIVSLVLRVEDSQAVFHGHARRDDKDRIGKSRIMRVLRFVQRGPGDEHRHHDGLARSRGHLAAIAEEFGVGFLQRNGVAVHGHGDKTLTVGGVGFVKPNDRLDRFALAEEERHVTLGLAEVPMFEQAPGYGRDAAIAFLSPQLHPPPNLVDAFERDELLFELAAVVLRALGRIEVPRRPPLAFDQLGLGALSGLEVHDLPITARLLVGPVADRALDRRRAGGPSLGDGVEEGAQRFAFLTP
ncbi:MAG: hypothetical protein CNCCGFBP_01321 [Fimbriimonadaceae bacterium]|nr:hypothetical protein [Fimbriimonadaceae bacterium]